MIALIPARGGSKGVPRKNIKKLKGHPLISYTITACKLNPNIDRIVVSTEDKEIAQVSERYGAEVLDRPKELSQDNSTDWGVINHFFQSYNTDDAVYLRPTTPLRDPDKLSDAIDFYIKNRDRMSSLRSMHELPESPYKVFKIDEDGYCKGFFEDFEGIKDYTNLPRQKFPKSYQPNGYIDIAKRETIDSVESAFSSSILPFVSEFATEVDAQYEFDLLTHQLDIKENVLLNKLNELGV